MLKIKELRKANNLTMKALGDRMSIAESTVSAYENGRREPSLSTLMEFADLFGVTVDYLIGRTSTDKKLIVHQVNIGERALRPDVLRLAEECSALNELGVAAVSGYAERLLEEKAFRVKNDDAD